MAPFVAPDRKRNAPTPFWRRNLAIAREQVKRAVRHEDPTYFRVRHAVDRYREVDPKATLTRMLGRNADPTKDALDNLNIQNTVANENAFADYKAETEALSGEQDPRKWEEKMKASKEKAKERAIHAIDVAYDGAAEIISQLPTPTQDAAFNVFDMGQEFVGQVFDTLVTEMQAMLTKIVDFMKGVWTALANAWDTIVNTVDSAINWIRGIFLAGLPDDPQVPVRQPGTAGFDLHNGSNGHGNDIQNGTVALEFKLQWLSKPALRKNEVDQACLYLDHLLEKTFENRYWVFFNDPEKIDNGWEVQCLIGPIEESDLLKVILKVKEVIRTEDRRREPLPPPYDGVPTPDPVMYFSKFDVVDSTSAQEASSLALVKKRRAAAAKLPSALRARQSLVLNGH